MIKIEGTYNTAIVYADTIEAGAEGQIQKLVSQARAVPLERP